MTELPVSFGSVKDVLPAKDRWFFTKFAEGKQRTEGYDKFKTSSYQGLTPDEVTRMENAQEALRIAEQTANLSEQEFDKVAGNMAQGMGQTASPVVMPTLRDPNWQQGLAAAIGAVVDPQHAAEIGATPFNAQLDRQQQEFQQARLQHEAEKEQIQANNEVNRIRSEIAQAKMLKDSRRVTFLQESLRDVQKEISARQLKEYEQNAITERARIGLEKTSMAQTGSLERKYLDKMATAQTPEAKTVFAEMLKDQFPEKYANLTDEQIAALATETSGDLKNKAITAKTWEQVETERLMREPRLAQAWTNVDKTLKQIEKIGVDIQSVKQKILYYPDEFKLKASNIYSLIAQREAGKVAEALPSATEIADINRLIGQLEAQLENENFMVRAGGPAAIELARLKGIRDFYTRQRAEAAQVNINSLPLPPGPSGTPPANQNWQKVGKGPIGTKPKVKPQTPIRSKYRRGPNGEIIRG